MPHLGLGAAPAGFGGNADQVDLRQPDRFADIADLQSIQRGSLALVTRRPFDDENRWAFKRVYGSLHALRGGEDANSTCSHLPDSSATIEFSILEGSNSSRLDPWRGQRLIPACAARRTSPQGRYRKN